VVKIVPALVAARAPLEGYWRSWDFKVATTARSDGEHPIDNAYPSVELPYPAIRVIIGQHFHFCVSPRFWAWYIVGAFYDSQGYELWHTEIFLLYRDRRGYSLGLGEFDTGPSPPRFALLGECDSQIK
jgi:hypothetical protein